MKSTNNNGNTNISLQSKVAILFTASVLLALCVVWICQLLLFNNTYKTVLINAVKDDTAILAENIDSNNCQALVDRISANDDISVMVIDPAGDVLYEAHASYSPIADLDTTSLVSYYNTTVNNNGTYFQEARKLVYTTDYDSSDYTGNVPADLGDANEQYVVYTKLVENAEGDEYVIITSAVFAGGAAVSMTAILQTLLITAVFLIVSVATSFLISRNIVKPLASLTVSAKKLADGKTDVTFDAQGFKEIEELSDVLNHTAKELSTVDSTRRELIANVSHDLRTPLTLIKGYSEMMRDIPSECDAENLNVVIGETERLTRLVNDMLDLSRIQEGDKKANLKHFDFIPTLDDLVNRISTMLKAQNYTLNYDKALDKAVICGDEDKLMQVVYNLISNAINYIGEDKQITVRVSNNNGRMRVEVKDNGIGIDVEEVPHIWDRYYKSDRNHKRSTIGTGLGLSIVRSVMNLHPGGTYGVITTKGHGSNFYIELPLVKN